MDTIVNNFSIPEVPTLYMGIGIPGSGKSTFLKKLEKKFDIAPIDGDEIRKWLLRDYHNHEFNKDIWKIIHLCIETSLKSGKSAIVDAVNVWNEYRGAEIKMYREFGAKKVIGVIVNTPLEICLQRNAQRGRHVSEDFIRKCNEKLRKYPPTEAEGFDEIVYI